MTRPLFYLDEAPATPVPELIGREIEPGAEVSHHAVRVQRLRAGEEIELCDGRGLRLGGAIVGTEALRVRIDEAVREPAPAPRLVLAQALAKGDRDLQAVEAATEIGVDAVVPFSARRSIAKWPAAKAEKLRAKWEHTLVAAARQSRRAHIPTLLPPTDAAGLARMAAEPGTLVLVLHEEATEPLAGVDLDAPGLERIVLVIGPEGGMSPEECGELAAAGGRLVRLGSGVLRTSSAGPAAATVLSVRLGRWD